jgi:hypothetical protein
MPVELLASGNVVGSRGAMRSCRCRRVRRVDRGGTLRRPHRHRAGRRARTRVAIIGALEASFPANLTADPVVAVALGAVLLHEDVPGSPLHLLAYVACVAAIILGAVRLADRTRDNEKPDDSL